jgi:hypothetical protein
MFFLTHSLQFTLGTSLAHGRHHGAAGYEARNGPQECHATASRRDGYCCDVPFSFTKKKFGDHYQTDGANRSHQPEAHRQADHPTKAKPAAGNVIDLMEALAPVRRPGRTCARSTARSRRRKRSRRRRHRSHNSSRLRTLFHRSGCSIARVRVGCTSESGATEDIPMRSANGPQTAHTHRPLSKEPMWCAARSPPLDILPRWPKAGRLPSLALRCARRRWIPGPTAD